MTDTFSIAQAALDAAAALPLMRTAVVHPTTKESLDAAVEARQAELIDPVLVGPRAKIVAAAEAAGEDVSGFEIVDAEHSHDAAAKAAAMAADGAVAALMKGSLHTSELLKAVLAEKRLRTERRMSHTYVLETDKYPKPLIVTDSGLNVAPDLNTKADIARNAADLFACLSGSKRPAKIAVLAAVETVKASMPVTVEAAALCKMAERGQIKGCLIDGPLAFDNAISVEAARIKGIESDVAGDPDVLLVPDVEAGNMLAKQMTFLGGAEAAATVLGARCPIILPSRSDTLRTRLLSCALAVNLAHARGRL
ncbi:MAG: bifunctional enoyl-CoA hydratase/phosphate acetyltransferase [Myxococcota bacterium]